MDGDEDENGGPGTAKDAGENGEDDEDNRNDGNSVDTAPGRRRRWR